MMPIILYLYTYTLSCEQYHGMYIFCELLFLFLENWVL